MNTLTFKILPSEVSNDRQVRIEIDGQDLLGSGFLGIDPSRFFRQKNLFRGGEILIGRCDCGFEGCCDYVADVEISENKVIWNIKTKRFEFDEYEYTDYIHEKGDRFIFGKFR
ncbi:hypothetical protein [Hugenholtzia roseola]|uniref:hypothetical protein n=1 Tax=Hugenholtzia roseola TaxID=1002 RepID=UPI00047A08D5|nr:hypothetical protein [Hugenholtzia roseola]